MCVNSPAVCVNRIADVAERERVGKRKMSRGTSYETSGYRNLFITTNGMKKK